MSQIMGAGGGGGVLIPANFADSPNPGVSLNPIVGVAITAKRSDEILALDQTAAYAFTGLGKTTISAGGIVSAAALMMTGTILTGGTGTTNFPHFFIQPAAGAAAAINWNTLGVAIGVNLASGFGGNFIDMRINGNNSVFLVNNVGAVTANGVALSAGQTGTGASGFLYFNTRAAMRSPSPSSITFENNASTAINTLAIPATATWQFGGDNAASPAAQTLKAQDSRAGTDSNVGGASLTITSGLGTGTGTRSVLTLQSPVIVASGSGAQTQTTGLRIDDGTAVTTGYAVAALPATPLTGARAHVTDALAPTFLATIVGGGAIITPVFYNGSNWVGG